MVTTFSNYFFKTLVTEELFSPSKEYMSAHNDQLLIKQILDGDTKAFAGLVNSYKNMVFSLALQMLKNKEEAEEVSQDAFVKVFRHLQNFKGDSKFSTWVYRITYNACLDRIKTYRSRVESVMIDEFTENRLKTLETAFDLMNRSDREKSIKACLFELPENDSILITLFYYEDLSLSEIAQIIGSDPNNIKVSLFRARKRLATILRARLESTMLEDYGPGNR